MLHALPGKQEEEFWVRGVARRVQDPALRARVVVAAEGTVRIRPEEWLFEYEIEAAGSTVWEGFGTADHRPARRLWRAPSSGP
jgi:hypothetical protein